MQVLPLVDHDTQRFIGCMTPAKPPLRAWPGPIVWRVKSTLPDKLYLVIELVRLDTNHAQLL